MPPVPGELHPFLSHFAVALLLIGPACDAFGVALRRDSLLHAGRWNTLLGAACAAAALASGLGARAALGSHGPAGEALLNLHGALAWVLAAAWAPVALWRALAKPPLPTRLRTAYLALAFTGAIACAGDGLLGSALVYRHGMGLSPAARAEPLPRPPTIDR
ncbi:MAG: DUF2231 domain-containing protein [Deltaproteobacteria bacterium]|nr:MAG: DUF2231 domain-containing protein [Deltaproteobacteria bacterium]TMB27267.1 MAG: DUF2231 domain-containing protein [Deltaproteobacteria bacterium]TMB28607.1 MAG: DUF2231 domain-containing protein [Deltaproteobacteria bacterium]